MIYYSCHYNGLLNNPINHNQKSIIITDHLNGFNYHNDNVILSHLKKNHYDGQIYIEYIIDDDLLKKYNLKLNFSFLKTQLIQMYSQFENYNVHPLVKFNNFICSFNGTAHVSRQILTSILYNLGYFNEHYCSKNFSYENSCILGHLKDLLFNDNNEFALYMKFFNNSELFNSTVYSFGHVQFDHASNIYNLENKLTQSFIHIVSETMATSYKPYITEKFLYSIVTRGLFLAYAPPLWHRYIEKYYGFKLYNRIFDYSFDEIKNPVKRLVRLMEMISKFAHLSVDDWMDLYQMEIDVIEYNRDHYFSKQYLRCLKKYE